MKEVKARTPRVLCLIIVASLMLLIGVGLAVTWYSRVKVAAIQSRALSADLLSALRSANGFQVRNTIADIPPLVRAAFAKATHQEFSMAEPGEKWQSTDVIVEPRLPWRRLTAVAVSAHFCLVFYERGGIAKSNNVAVFRLSSRGAEAVWHAYLDDSVADPAGLAVAIDEKRVYIDAAHF